MRSITKQHKVQSQINPTTSKIYVANKKYAKQNTKQAKEEQYFRKLTSKIGAQTINAENKANLILKSRICFKEVTGFLILFKIYTQTVSSRNTSI